jgi:hypothetical protein
MKSQFTFFYCDAPFFQKLPLILTPLTTSCIQQYGFACELN